MRCHPGFVAPFLKHRQSRLSIILKSLRMFGMIKWILALIWSHQLHCACMLSRSIVCLFVTPWTTAHIASVHGILQARILEWVTNFLFQGIFLAQGSNARLLCLLHWQADFFNHQATWEAPPAALAPNSKESVCPLKPWSQALTSPL